MGEPDTPAARAQAPDVQAFGAILGFGINDFLKRREAEGANYIDTVIDLTAVLGHHASILFASVECDVHRDKFVELFIKHLAPEVDRQRLHGLMALAQQRGVQ